ncbi:MAG: hypothetical protein K6F94_08675 [Bacteroidaceae bacterium]|nr:hypothetical protein [Bacteroidaceae bacterium]
MLNRLQYLFLSLLATGILFTSCKEDTVPFNISPSLTIMEPSGEDITRTTVLLEGTASKDMHNSFIQQVGVQCATNSAFTEDGDLRTIPCSEYSENTLNNPLLIESGYVLRFNGKISGLSPNTRYWVRSYAMSDTLHPDISTAYSPSIVFNTPATSAPSFGDVTLGNPETTSAPIAVQLTDLGSELLTYDDVEPAGYIYRRITNAEQARDLRMRTPGVKTVIKYPDAEGRIDTVLTDLVPGAIYAVRAFAVADGTGYSEIKTFQTQNTSMPAVSVARNTGSQEVGQVNLAADVIAKGSSNITARGFVYSSIVTEPELVGSTVISCDLSGGDAFTASIQNLSVGTTYYVRAYATNNAGTGYSSEVLKITLSGEINAPTVSTISVSLTTSEDETAMNMAEMVGFLASNGGGSVEEVGFELSPEPNMENAEKFHAALDANNMFRAISYQLSAGQTYYIRAFAQNVAGIAYGEVKSVSVPYLQNTVPYVVTSQVEVVSSQIAAFGGYVRNEGGSQITAVGFQVSKNQNMSDPTEYDANLGEEYEFWREIHDLEPNTTYYVRAFAVNATGTGYGSVRAFTTSSEQNVPVVVTQMATPGSTTAELLGFVEYSDGTNVSSVGFEVSTDSTMSQKTVYPGSFEDNMYFYTTAGNLQASTKYYVRAFAVNAVGTGYGDIISFTTLEPETSTPSEDDNPYPTQGVKGQRKTKTVKRK